jgi:hypothetical protein
MLATTPSPVPAAAPTTTQAHHMGVIHHWRCCTHHYLSIHHHQSRTMPPPSLPGPKTSRGSSRLPLRQHHNPPGPLNQHLYQSSSLLKALALTQVRTTTPSTPHPPCQTVHTRIPCRHPSSHGQFHNSHRQHCCQAALHARRRQLHHRQQL